MNRKPKLLFTFLLCGALLTGCEKKQNPVNPNVPAPAKNKPSGGYFDTHYQEESQFIMENILSDLTEMISFAQTGNLPDPEVFSVEATGSATGQTVAYEAQIAFSKKSPPVKIHLELNHPIWSPETYDDAAKALADAMKFSHGHAQREVDDGSVLKDLTDARAVTIESLNQTVSTALQADFQNPTLHEKAAAILGAFAIRETSGYFYDVRSILCRMTAHLQFVRLMAGDTEPGVSGRIAEVALCTQMGNQRDALEKIKAIDSKDSAVSAWKNALSLRNNFDYRLLAGVKDVTEIEKIAELAAQFDSADGNEAWAHLPQSAGEIPDYCRVAMEAGHSVETGNNLLQYSIPLELAEIDQVQEAVLEQKFTGPALMEKLNRMPERCFQITPAGKPTVKVIGWGQWAMQLQRHLCNTVRHNFYIMRYSQGWKEEAAKFTAENLAKYGALRLYPFAQHFMCEDDAAYHKAVDQAAQVMFTAPDQVSPILWNELSYPVFYTAYYFPRPDPHVNEWFRFNPPAGTAYVMHPRFNHPSLMGRADIVSVLETLHQIAPYNGGISEHLVALKYGKKPTSDQLAEVYQAGLDYMVSSLFLCADAAIDQPEKYEPLMKKAAAIHPSYYWDLSNFFRNRKQMDKAVAYAEKAYVLDPDKVRVSGQCQWLMEYYYNKGNKDRAKEIADFGGQVYSWAGLITKAVYFEIDKQYDNAFEWYEKAEERYQSSDALIKFCLRYRQKTKDTKFEPEILKRGDKIFPKGQEKGDLNSFKESPRSGVLINDDNDLLAAAGLGQGTIIVAAFGIKVHSLIQYTYLRSTVPGEGMDLIYWQNGAYHQVHANPPERMFQSNFSDYKAKK